jgi:hypothetical protein
MNMTNLNYFYICFIKLQEEALMDKKQQKRGNKEYKESPTLIYTTSCKEDSGREIIRSSYPYVKVI